MSESSDSDDTEILLLMPANYYAVVNDTNSNQDLKVHELAKNFESTTLRKWEQNERLVL